MVGTAIWHSTRCAGLIYGPALISFGGNVPPWPYILGPSFYVALLGRPGVKYVFEFDSSLKAYLNYIAIRVYLYLYLIENGVFVFEFLGKSVFDPAPLLDNERHAQGLLVQSNVF